MDPSNFPSTYPPLQQSGLLGISSPRNRRFNPCAGASFSHPLIYTPSSLVLSSGHLPLSPPSQSRVETPYIFHLSSPMPFPGRLPPLPLSSQSQVETPEHLHETAHQPTHTTLAVPHIHTSSREHNSLYLPSDPPTKQIHPINYIQQSIAQQSIAQHSIPRQICHRCSNIPIPLLLLTPMRLG